ncbi:MAG: endonuclease V [Nanoarchaeota archaeon]
MITDKEADIVKRLGIDLDRLKSEQVKISRAVSVIDSLDFDNVDFFGSFSNFIVGNKILCGVVVVNGEQEVVEEKFFVDKVSFPYLSEFRSYRELPSMIKALSLLENKPQLVLIDGLGINHSRLGLATHFSINSSIPSIGISDSDLGFVIKGDKFFLDGRQVGCVVQSKVGSKPLFVSPGSGISIDTSGRIVKSLVTPPHKLPGVMKLARKYVKRISKEIFGKE